VSRLAVMAHYDPRGEVGPHVRRQVAALAEGVDDLVIVTTAELTDASRSWLTGHGRLIERDNFGYDFFSYKTGLDAVADLTAYDEVVICNDTYVGPLTSYRSIFAEMADQPVDFWGLTGSERIRPHLQSFFVVFRSWLVGSDTFRGFWETMTPISNRSKVIHRYEVGMSTLLTDAGFRWAPYFTENDGDRSLARRRMLWWTAHRAPWPPGSREERAWFSEQRRAPWNPAIGLADAALSAARLPYVKLDTLRYDPYGLNADRLLSLCEKAYPDAFDGVRSFLGETATFYPPREAERLRPTPALLKPMRSLVEYGRAA
jgi:Rhamnan synthesis protein F